ASRQLLSTLPLYAPLPFPLPSAWDPASWRTTNCAIPAFIFLCLQPGIPPVGGLPTVLFPPLFSFALSLGSRQLADYQLCYSRLYFPLPSAWDPASWRPTYC